MKDLKRTDRRALTAPARSDARRGSALATRFGPRARGGGGGMRRGPRRPAEPERGGPGPRPTSDAVGACAAPREVRVRERHGSAGAASVAGSPGSA